MKKKIRHKRQPYALLRKMEMTEAHLELMKIACRYDQLLKERDEIIKTYELMIKQYEGITEKTLKIRRSR